MAGENHHRLGNRGHMTLDVEVKDQAQLPPGTKVSSEKGGAL
jgi:hypothetical protein